MKMRVFFIAVIVLGISLTGIFSLRTRKPVVPSNPDTPTGTPTPSPDPLAPKTVLLLGYAGGTHDGGLLTDTIILFHIRPRDNAAVMVSVPRDLLVSIPVSKSEHRDMKVNAAYAIGNDSIRYPDKDPKYTGKLPGLRLASDVIGEFTGQTISGAIAINFTGFEKAIDILGGVPVDVPVTFEDPWYPIEENKNDTCGMSETDFAALESTLSGQLLERAFPCRFELLRFDKGLVTMDGKTALKFVRSRNSPLYGGDYARTERQRALLVAIKEKLLRIGTLPKIIPLGETLLSHVESNLDFDDAFELLRSRSSLLEGEIHTLSLTEDNVLAPYRTDDGQYVLIPKEGIGNWSGLQEFLRKEIDLLISAPAGN